MGKHLLGPRISQQDCYKVISAKLNNEDCDILDIQQNPFEEIQGYLGEHSSLTIHVARKNGNKESFTFFVKSVPHVPSQRIFLEDINGYLKEKNFFIKYCLLLQQLSVNVLEEAVPFCHLVSEESFIFEDMASKGYTSLSSRKSMNLDCIKVALTSLAKLHASGLILEELKSFRLTQEFSNELQESFYLGTDSTIRGVNSCKLGLEALIDVTHNDEMKISKDVFKIKIREACDLQKVFVVPGSRFRNTICHADLWTRNFMFKFDQGQATNCVIVDFQTYRYGPPAQDVMTFLHLVSDRETREYHMDELLLFYYKQLDTNLKSFGFTDVVTRNEFLESCCYFKQFALTQALMHFQVVILRDDIATELFANPEKAKRVIFGDERYDFIRETCQKDPVFRKMNIEALEELREFYENKLGE